MRRTGTADLPLHRGKVPPWLFQRMVRLARALMLALVEDFGPHEALRRLADPFWFQAFGCLLGFDWHSSGLTTTVCGALKAGLEGLEGDTGLYVAGGKGALSRRTPQEILLAGERLGRDFSPLVRASRLSAKVDNTALQDGHTLYHHTFLFTADGAWAVVQQGMDPQRRTARRYHWLGEKVQDFAREPHTGVVGVQREGVLNLVAEEAEGHRRAILHLVREEPAPVILRTLERARHLRLPHRHHLEEADLPPRSLERVLLTAYERPPRDFADLLALEGLGPRALRALSLTAELLYGEPPSHRDPALYAFAHGGKDGHPYPVDRATYDRTLAFLEDALRRARLGDRERLEALRRLRSLGRPG